MAAPHPQPDPNAPPSPSRRRRWLYGGLGLVALLGALFAWYRLAAAGPMTVLVLGVDGDGVRSDVSVVAHWQPTTRQLHLVSLPRDLRTPIPCQGIPGCETPSKLAHAYAYGTLPGGPGGPELATKAAAALLGVPVRHYVVVDFRGFEQVVDALGGVTIDVAAAMDYDDPYQNLSIHIPAGRRHLDGRTALGYVRYRSDGSGDIGRIERTHKFFLALLDSARQSGNLVRLPALVTQLLGQVRTNIDAATLVRLARIGVGLQAEQLQTATVPGQAQVIDGLWYWVADPAGLRRVVATHISERQD